MPRLFHVSDDPNIQVLEPRPHASWPSLGPRVWAIEERLLQNYLLPRDCPRVTFYAVETSSAEDIDCYLSGDGDKHVVRVEDAWLDRIKAATLYLYQLPEGQFSSFDAGAGYWTSETAVRPVSVTEVRDLPAALMQRRVDFGTLPSLWELHDAVAVSSLQFSMIRMRFAGERKFR